MRTIIFALLAGSTLGGCVIVGGKDSDTAPPPTDADGDGYNSDVDCDDENASINPDITESCDGVDNNCDGEVDEPGAEGSQSWYADSDADSYGDAGNSLIVCSQPEGYVSDATDCNDADPAISPAATEVCDTIDNNCDGSVDEGVLQTWYADTDADGFGDPVATAEACTLTAGYVSDNTDCDDTNALVNPGTAEFCDGLDNDCNSSIDDGLTFVDYYMDADSDSYGDDSMVMNACAMPTGYSDVGGDCNDGDAAISPAASEACDDIDNDCNGSIDDNLAYMDYYLDADSDTYGDDAMVVNDCAMPAGYSDVGGDCNDGDAAINPAATEVCDGADTDEDCDGLVDDADDSVTGQGLYYMDADADTYGDPAMPGYYCDQPADYVVDATDCDDTRADVNPAGTEVCDADDTDEDCDGYVDQFDPSSNYVTYYIDQDRDGYGLSTFFQFVCDQPSGYVTVSGDCNDTNATINPGAAEICDSADTDENCNGLADNADSTLSNGTTWYIDTDGDGSGDDDGMVMTCEQPSGYVDNANDPFEDAALVALADDGDLQETTDVTAGSAAVYAVGFNADGDPMVVSIDPTMGTVSEVWSGEPLVQPTGIALSADESTLYVADLAAETASGTTSGGIFEIPVGGGSCAEIGVAGTIDAPGDVTWGPTDSTILVTGFDSVGIATIFEVDVTSGGTMAMFSGSPLVDPMAIDMDANTGMTYVVDSLAADGMAAVLVFNSGWSYSDELASGFTFAFPGGIALDAGGSMAFYSTVQSASVVAVMTDGSGASTTISSGFSMPGGLAAGAGDVLYITELATDTADLYTLTY